MSACLVLASSALVLLPVAVSAAPPEPFVFPQNDVTVVYRTDDGLQETFRASAATGLQRVDAPGGGLAIITDNTDRTITILDPRAHTFSVGPAPAGTADLRGRRAPGGYVPAGRIASVAGLTCTEWITHDPAGQKVTACLTDDGALLRVRAGGRTLVEAQSVRHEALDPSLFRAPAAWREVSR